jgi:hypothetical protein
MSTVQHAGQVSIIKKEEKETSSEVENCIQNRKIRRQETGRSEGDEMN